MTVTPEESDLTQLAFDLTPEAEGDETAAPTESFAAFLWRNYNQQKESRIAAQDFTGFNFEPTSDDGQTTP
jgi:hypothetical protein